MVGWLAALGIGAYFYRAWQERNPVRARFLRQFGLILSILGVAGLILLFLKSLQVPVVGWPLWSYLIALATIAYAAWGAWYFNSRIPQVTVSSGRQPPRAVRTSRAYSSNGARAAENKPSEPPRSVSTTGRREARRDRKRKGR
jgi:hypothetical protein